MEWAVAITAVKERIANGLLESSINSLVRAGFVQGHIFLDGPLDFSPWIVPHDWAATTRSEKCRIFANWYLAAWEMLALHPKADRYAFFQDDIECSSNLRAYLEKCVYPEAGYLNLFTYPENETKDLGVWAPSPHQSGRGALGLVFTRDILLEIVTHPRMAARFDDEDGWKNLDGAIVTTASLLDIKEYVHTPSLIGHTGQDCSTVGHRLKSKGMTYRGPDFDCLSLTPDTKTKPNAKVHKRIGLAGSVSHLGEGWINKRLAAHLDVEVWLINPNFGETKAEEIEWAKEQCDIIICPTGKEEKIREFLSKVDVVLFSSEYNPPYHKLISLCKEMGKRIVCVPTFFQCKEWCADVDLFITPMNHPLTCPTFTLPITHYQIPWPIDDREWLLLEEEYHRAIRYGERYVTAWPGREIK